jgi:hypothetical protein
MYEDRIHVTLHDRAWRAQFEGGMAPSKVVYGKAKGWVECAFWAAGRLFQLRGGTLIVHNPDGSVKEEWVLRRVGDED